MSARSPGSWFMVMNSTLLRPRIARPFERSAPAQHPHEPEVVRRGGDEPAAARERDRGLEEPAPGRRLGEPEPAVLGLNVVRRQPVRLALADMKARVAHFEGGEDALVEERIERDAGPDLDEPAEHVGGDAVVPARSRLKDERLGGGGFHELGERPDVRVELDRAVAIERIDRVLVLESVGEPRGVDHEVVHGDGPREGHRGEAFGLAALEHPCPGERGDELRDRIVELEAAILVEHQRRDGRDRLRHRVDAVNRVGLDRFARTPRPGARRSRTRRGDRGARRPRAGRGTFPSRPSAASIRGSRQGARSRARRPRAGRRSVSRRPRGGVERRPGVGRCRHRAACPTATPRQWLARVRDRAIAGTGRISTGRVFASRAGGCRRRGHRSAEDSAPARAHRDWSSCFKHICAVFLGSRASRPPGPEARHGQPAEGPQVFMRAGRPRSQGNAFSV